jgi:hypothetical protein
MDFSALHCALFSISAIYADGLDFYFTKEGDPKKFGGRFGRERAKIMAKIRRFFKGGFG